MGALVGVLDELTRYPHALRETVVFGRIWQTRLDIGLEQRWACLPAEYVLQGGYTFGMRAISQREMRNDSGEILRQTEAGEVFVVTRRGMPVAQLIPYAGGRQAIKPAWQDASFDVSELVASSIPTSTVLEDMRGER